jgi:hypothetical protein
VKLLLSILWNLKIHNRAHNIPPPGPALSQINPVHTTPAFLKVQYYPPIYAIIVLVIPFLPAFPPISHMLSSLPPPPTRVTCPASLWLDHSSYTRRRIRVMKLLILQFSPTSCHFLSFRSKYPPHSPALKPTQSVFLPLYHDHSYRTTGKMIVLCILIFTFLYIRRGKKEGSGLNGIKHYQNSISS